MDAEATVVISKLSGETLEFSGDLTQSVRDFKQKIAEQAGVPPLCQRLTIHDLDSSRAEAIWKSATPHLVQQVAKPVEYLQKRDVSEVKALNNPPRPMVEALGVVQVLVAGNEQLGLERQDGTAIPMTRSWRGPSGIKHMLANVDVFLAVVKNWPQDVMDGNISEDAVCLAEKEISQMGPDFSVYNLRRYSKMVCKMCEWVLGALKFYRETWPRLRVPGDSTSLELVDSTPLGAYHQEASRFQLSLVVDMDPLWGPLEAFDDQLLEAVDALGVLGSRCPERALQALAGKLGNRQELGERARRAVRNAWSSPDPEACTYLLDALSVYRRADIQIGVMDTLVYLNPADLRVLDKIIDVFCAGEEETRDHALAHFRSLQEHFDAKAVSQRCIVALSDISQARPDEEYQQVFEALSLVSQRDYDAAISGLATLLSAETPPFKQARAATLAAQLAKEEDEQLIPALRAAVEQISGPHALETVAALVKISPSSYSHAIASCCAELRKNRYGDRGDAISTLRGVAREADEQALAELLRYLSHAERLLQQEGAQHVLAALEVAQRLATETPARVAEARAAVMLVLATEAAGGKPKAEPTPGGVKQRLEKLEGLAQEQGAVATNVFRALAKGFENPQKPVRQDCLRSFQRLCKAHTPPGEAPLEVLLEVIDEDIFTFSRCLAIQALPCVKGASAPQVAELTERLVRLCAEAEVAVRSAALAALRHCACPGPKTSEAVLVYVQDPDESVRLAAVRALAALQEDRGSLAQVLLKRLEDRSVAVVMMALGLLGKIRTAGLEEELCVHLAPLLGHVDEQVRAAAAAALGETTGEAKARARSALQEQRPWLSAETARAVLAAKEKAVQALSA